jgi:hypothetical protein
MSGQRPAVSMLETSKEIGAKRFRARPQGPRTKMLGVDQERMRAGRKRRDRQVREVDASGKRVIGLAYPVRTRRVARMLGNLV